MGTGYTSVFYRVQIRRDWPDGKASPWEDERWPWGSLGEAIIEAQRVRAAHDPLRAGHALAVRVVKVKLNVLKEYPPLGLD